MTEKMPNEVDLKVINDRVVLEGFPENIKLRRLNYHSENLAMLKALSIASINIQASKFYMDSIRNSPREIDPHMFDAAILAAILKYGSVFKIDKKGKKIKPEVIFGQKIRILNRSVDERPIEIDDPNRAYLEHHRFFLDLRDKFIAHDDRIIGHTDCFATLDENFVCDQVLVLSQRSSVFSAIKPRFAQLPICIDAVFTWLALAKDHQCQIVANEVNSLKRRARESFPEPTFPSYKGLSDADERKARKEKVWAFNWMTGRKESRDIN